MDNGRPYRQREARNASASRREHTQEPCRRRLAATISGLIVLGFHPARVTGHEYAGRTRDGVADFHSLETLGKPEDGEKREAAAVTESAFGHGGRLVLPLESKGGDLKIAFENGDVLIAAYTPVINQRGFATANVDDRARARRRGSFYALECSREVRSVRTNSVGCLLVVDRL
jgi:hypothetical protein